MKNFIIYIIFIPLISLFFNSCSKELKKPKEAKILFSSMPKTYLKDVGFDNLPHWDKENYSEALKAFIDSCRSSKTKKIYRNLCKSARDTTNAKKFLESNFNPFVITDKKSNSTGLLTGYYEASVKGSLKKNKIYRYPIYETPSDLINIKLNSIFPNLKNHRLKGRIVGNNLVPYYTRKEHTYKKINAKVICYVDSKIDLFFLEIQGSGRVKLDNGKTIYIGYANQNGHQYKSIGKYLARKGALRFKDVSLQSIKQWLREHPNDIDNVLNINKSQIYFSKRKYKASGSLGLKLLKNRSIAVDRSFIPLGGMLYMSAKIENKYRNHIVMAQDVGGDIKGAVRADLFLGFGSEAMRIAGRLKSKLNLWILLPKTYKSRAK